MNTCIENPLEISAALRAWSEKNKMTQTAISTRIGLNQSQVSRFLSGDFVRVTDPIKKLCKYAEISLISSKSDPRTNVVLMEALERTWDGSDRHAKLLAKVILALG